MHLGHFTVISPAEKVTTLYSVLSVCQDGSYTQSLKSITIPDRTSVIPVSNINGVAGSVTGCKWKQQCNPSNFSLYLSALSSHGTPRSKKNDSSDKMLQDCLPVRNVKAFVIGSVWSIVFKKVLGSFANSCKCSLAS